MSELPAFSLPLRTKEQAKQSEPDVKDPANLPVLRGRVIVADEEVDPVLAWMNRISHRSNHQYRRPKKFAQRRAAARVARGEPHVPFVSAPKSKMVGTDENNKFRIIKLKSTIAEWKTRGEAGTTAAMKSDAYLRLNVLELEGRETYLQPGGNLRSADVQLNEIARVRKVLHLYDVNDGETTEEYLQRVKSSLNEDMDDGKEVVEKDEEEDEA